jgi:16S rRNA (uracil1498-N3)-methyltransferase
MTRRRWIADEVSGNRAYLRDSHADHLVRVLRVQLGQQFDIATSAKVFRGTVSAIRDHVVEFDLGEELPASESTLDITLALAIFKFDRMEWAIEKCTELGVSRIIPVVARRTAAHLARASVKRVERWQRIAFQASEQCRRAVVPTIESPIDIRAASQLQGTGRIVLAESEQDVSLREALERFSNPTNLVLAVGPEGGWTSEELAIFQEHRWTAATLGSTILRAETAAIAAMAITSALLS